MVGTLEDFVTSLFRMPFWNWNFVTVSIHCFIIIVPHWTSQLIAHSAVSKLNLSLSTLSIVTANKIIGFGLDWMEYWGCNLLWSTFAMEYHFDNVIKIWNVSKMIWINDFPKTGLFWSIYASSTKLCNLYATKLIDYSFMFTLQILEHCKFREETT